MNVESLIMAILDNTPQSRQQKIKTISQKIVSQISELDEIQKQKKIEEERHLLEAFFKILDTISVQIRDVKSKYQSIDKQKMKEQKCIAIAKDIKIFKEECFYLRARLTEAKKQLKQARIENQLMQEQQEMLEKVYHRKSREKDDVKMRTLSQFWNRSQGKDKQKQIFDQRKTQFQFRTDPFEDKNLQSDKAKRLIETSLEHRRYGRSLDVNKSVSFKKMVNKKYLKYKILDE